MVRQKSPTRGEVDVVCGRQQQEALSALLHWLKGATRVEVVPRGNVFHGPVSMHIEFKSRRRITDFLGIMEGMTCMTLKKESLLQVDIEIDLKKLMEETS